MVVHILETEVFKFSFLNSHISETRLYILLTLEYFPLNKMAALRSRCGHYYFAALVTFFFFPRLFSAVGDRARQLYKNISMLFLFPVTRDLLFTNI